MKNLEILIILTAEYKEASENLLKRLLTNIKEGIGPVNYYFRMPRP